ncbi:MAG: hypothetical protein Q7V12_04360, partial [Deltaproteobacteria bacterium]|nr:hypothetical protein [Deltaproteobacteria bacterium]
TKRPEPNPLVMLNLFQHLVGFFLLSADASFIPVHRKGFSNAILINYYTPYGLSGKLLNFRILYNGYQLSPSPPGDCVVIIVLSP